MLASLDKLSATRKRRAELSNTAAVKRQRTYNSKGKARAMQAAENTEQRKGDAGYKSKCAPDLKREMREKRTENVIVAVVAQLVAAVERQAKEAAKPAPTAKKTAAPKKPKKARAAKKVVAGKKPCPKCGGTDHQRSTSGLCTWSPPGPQ